MGRQPSAKRSLGPLFASLVKEDRQQKGSDRQRGDGFIAFAVHDVGHAAREKGERNNKHDPHHPASRELHGASVPRPRWLGKMTAAVVARPTVGQRTA